MRVKDAGIPDMFPINGNFCQDFDDQMSGFVRILPSDKTAGTLHQLGPVEAPHPALVAWLNPPVESLIQLGAPEV